MDSQESIRLYDPSFYEAILPFMNKMPDMRPQETIQKMRQVIVGGRMVPECQDSWKLVETEISALSLNEEHKRIIDIINEGDLSRLRPYLKRKTTEDMVFTYPALLWLLLHISPKETIIPFLILHGLYLGNLNITKADIEFIRSEETAKILYREHPDVLRNDERFLIAAIQENRIGYFYWAFVSGKRISTGTFFIAIHYNRIKMAKLMLKNKVFQNKGDDKWHTALCIASQGHVEILQILLGLVSIDETYQKPLFLAIKGEHIDVVSLLLPFYTTLRPNILDTALTVNNERILELIFNHQGCPSTQNNLYFAICKGYKKCVEILLKKPTIDPSLQNNLALMKAISHNHLDIVEILLKDDRVDSSDRQNTFLEIAIKNKNRQILELLLQNPLVDPSAFRNRALKSAIAYENIEAMSLLLSNERVKSSAKIFSLIDLCIREGRMEAFRILLPLNENKEKMMHFLLLAMRYGQQEMVEILLKRVDPL